jgi:hypothetical protein
MCYSNYTISAPRHALVAPILKLIKLSLSINSDILSVLQTVRIRQSATALFSLI